MLGAISPLLIVENARDAAAFYCDKLGFEVRHQSPEADPFFFIVGRDQTQIFLKEIAPEIEPVPNRSRHPWARIDAFVYVSDPKSVATDFRKRGLTSLTPVVEDDDGLIGFEVDDADGYRIYFGRPR